MSFLEDRVMYGDKFSLAELERTPSISGAHFADLKIESDCVRVILSRMKIADGSDYDNKVTIDVLSGGEWVTHDEYKAR